MNKYTCNRGSFVCKYCGTIYPYSDLRDECEGRPYYREWAEHPAPVLDELQAEVGEKVLMTCYVGNEYSQPPKKAGLQLLYSWKEIREKRISPLSRPIYSFLDKREEPFVHATEYKIGFISSQIKELIGDHWDVSHNMSSSTSVGSPLGPRHVWSKHLVEHFLREAWPNYILEKCYGENTSVIRCELKQQGYEIFG